MNFPFALYEINESSSMPLLVSDEVKIVRTFGRLRELKMHRKEREKFIKSLE